MEDRRFAFRVLVERPEERDHWEHGKLDWRIILKWIFKKQDWA
jgi:hypothetical protein